MAEVKAATELTTTAAARPLGEEQGWTHRKDHDSLRQQPPAARLTQYYRDQLGLVPAAEWDAFVEDMRSPLPATLWINDTDPLAHDVAAYFKTMPELMKPIAWYPIPDMAWQMSIDKKTFRKDPSLGPLRQYLIRQTAMGLTSRQESVSMIPPFLLDVQPNDRCLDMCASPGSKTAQLLATLGRVKRGQPPSGPAAARLPFDYLSAGCVVANEKDEKRANMLVYQVKRLRQLFPFAAFVNHDARFLPEVTGPDGAVLKYDKVLCDVVCSGDGTLRKAPNLFAHWRPNEAVSLQRIQIQIAMRGCHVLKVGGRLVYSTCSMNPIENEAVVCQLLQRTNGAMRLVDARGLLPNLRCDPGLLDWKVASLRGELCAAPGDHNMHPACFPPGPEAAAAMRLDLCMRFLPKHCEGGAFFIAVLEKVAEFEQPIAADGAEGAPAARPKASRPERANGPAPSPASPSTAAAENSRPPPPRYVPSLPEASEYLSSFFGVEGFPSEQLYSRATPGSDAVVTRTLGTICSFVSKDVRQLLDAESRLIIVAAGLRTLAVESLTKSWRIAHEAGFLLEKFVQQRRIPALPSDIAQLCGENSDANGVAFDKIENPELQTAMADLPLGCIVLQVATGNPAQPHVPVSAMRARNRLQLLVDKDDLDDLRCRLNIGNPTALQNDE